MVRIFLTGATGYVGGDVLYRLRHSSLANSRLSCLVRDTSKARHLSDLYPHVEIIQGGLDDSELVEQETRKADVILSQFVPSSSPLVQAERPLDLAATGHHGAASAIAKGLQGRAGSQNPGSSPHSKA